jgi:hypothetical protein
MSPKGAGGAVMRPGAGCIWIPLTGIHSRDGNETIVRGAVAPGAANFALKLVACKRLNRRLGDQLQRKVDPPPRHLASVTGTCGPGTGWDGTVRRVHEKCVAGA